MFKTTKKEEQKRELLLLQSPSEQKTLEIMNSISSNNKTHQELYALTKEQIKERLGKEFNCRVLTEKEIVEECYGLNLFFIKGSEYKGSFNVQKIKQFSEFLEKNKIITADYDYKSLVYLCGRTTYEERCDDLRYSYKLKLESEKDPILLFQINEQGEKLFVLFEKENRFFNLKNKFLSYYFHSFNNFCSANFILGMILGLMVFNVFFSPNIFVQSVVSLLFGAALSIIIRCIYLTGEVDNYFNKKIFESLYNYKDRINSFQRKVITLSLILITLFLWPFSLNLNLMFRGPVVEKTQTEKTLSDQEARLVIKEYKIDQEYIQHSLVELTYSAGIIFPKYKKENLNYSYSSKNIK